MFFVVLDGALTESIDVYKLTQVNPRLQIGKHVLITACNFTYPDTNVKWKKKGRGFVDDEGVETLSNVTGSVFMR